MKKYFFVTMVIFMLFTQPAFANADTSGMTFNSEDTYYTENPLPSLPSTFEATILCSADTTSRFGVIIGNYKSSSTDCLNFEIYENGIPRLYMVDNSQTVFDFKFANVNVCTGQWVHIAIVNDYSENMLSCYINGELMQTISGKSPQSIIFSNKFVLGGDLRSGNAQYFKGNIKNVALYSDVRTATEIKNDYSEIDLNDADIMLCYDLSTTEDGSYPSVIEDLSSNNIDMIFDSPWIKKKTPVSDYAYSLVAIGDTQTLTYYYPENLTSIYDWIVKNKFDKKIEYVFGLGDITDKNTDAEWALAKAVIQKLDGVVPYSLVRGNHDSSANYTRFFQYSDYADQLDGSFDGTMLNTYQKIIIGNHKYLIMNLDVGAKDDVLEWAGKIVEANSDYNVIVTTHIYLSTDGLPGATNAIKYVPDGNNGIDIWNKFISKYENIILVLSGHHSTNKIILGQAAGDNGNTVTQMLIDPQTTDKNLGPCGLITILYFSEDGKHVDVEYYSTVRDAYFMEKNQFSLELDTIESSSSEITNPKITVNDFSFNISLEGTDNTEFVFVALYDSKNKLKEVKQYDAAESINVEFDSAEQDDCFKIVWWNGLKPISKSQTIYLK